MTNKGGYWLFCVFHVAFSILLHGQVIKEHVDTIITGGVVVTMDGPRHVYDDGAVVVTGDTIVAVGPRAADYVVGAAGVSAVRFADSRDAANGIAGVLVPGDTVLVKASRSVALERVCEVLV